jgi:hypothetical protein
VSALPTRSEVEEVAEIACDLCELLRWCARFWVARAQVHLDVCSVCLESAVERIEGELEHLPDYR